MQNPIRSLIWNSLELKKLFRKLFLNFQYFIKYLQNFQYFKFFQKIFPDLDQKKHPKKSSKIGRRNGQGETLTRKLNLTQSCEARDGLAKAAYRKIFDYLLLTLNAANEPDQHSGKSHNQIGILDIFGFERVQEGNVYFDYYI